MTYGGQDQGELVFVPLGGVGEIGMNLALYGLGPAENRRWLLVDCGVAFAGAELPGIDLVLPDIRFIEEKRGSLAGIVLTHGHEDHYGALIELWPRLGATVYATPFTAALLEAKMIEEAGAPEIPLEVVPSGSRRQIGPFDVEFVPVAHSIPESHAIVLRTALGNVVHSGDWKVDASPVVGALTDGSRMAAIGEEGVRALVCDSTNALREGISPSEADVARELAGIMREAPQRVAVTLFASNVARIRSIAEAAQAAGREVVVVGRAMVRVITVARELGLLEGLKPFRDADVYGYLPRENVALLLTGSQGEARAALARVAAGDHPMIALSPGDTMVFSSRTIPGNEKAVGAIINDLVNAGVRVITDRERLVHVSGHPRQDELEMMYRWLRPEVAVPVHGEALHLETHARFARKIGVPEVISVRNGAMVRLAPGPAQVIDQVPSGRLVKDGRFVLAQETSGIDERRRLAFAGAVFVAVTLSTSGGVLADPLVEIVGLPEDDSLGEPLGDTALGAAIGALESIPRPRRRNPDLVADAVRRSVRGAIAQRWGKKPLVRVVVSVVGP